MPSSPSPQKKVITNGHHTVSTVDPALKAAINTQLLAGGYIPSMQSHLTTLLVQPIQSTSKSSAASTSLAPQTLSSLITALTVERLRASTEESSTPATYPSLMKDVRKQFKSQIPDDLKKEMIEYVRSILEEVV
jgi:hypothetical protein